MGLNFAKKLDIQKKRKKEKRNIFNLQRACVFGNRKLLDCSLLSFARGVSGDSICASNSSSKATQTSSLRKVIRNHYSSCNEIQGLHCSSGCPGISLSLSHTHPCLQYFTWKTRDRGLCWLRTKRETQRERHSYIFLHTFTETN